MSGKHVAVWLTIRLHRAVVAFAAAVIQKSTYLGFAPDSRHCGSRSQSGQGQDGEGQHAISRPISTYRNQAVIGDGGADDFFLLTFSEHDPAGAGPVP